MDISARLCATSVEKTADLSKHEDGTEASEDDAKDKPRGLWISTLNAMTVGFSKGFLF